LCIVAWSAKPDASRIILLTIQRFFLFGTVLDLTEEHLAATVTPPKGRDGSSQKMDIIDAGQSAAGSDLDE
jgi:hypothetical protein